MDDEIHQINCEEIDKKLLEYLNSPVFVEDILARIPEKLADYIDEKSIEFQLRIMFTTITQLDITIGSVEQCIGYLLQMGFVRNERSYNSCPYPAYIDMFGTFSLPGTSLTILLGRDEGGTLAIYTELSKNIREVMSFEEMFILRLTRLYQALIKKKVMIIHLKGRQRQARRELAKEI